MEKLYDVGEVPAAVRGLAMTSSGQDGGLEGGICDAGRLLGREAMREEPRECSVRRGPYLGDVSALCFLPSSPVLYLLAGLRFVFVFSPCRRIFSFDECFSGWFC